MHTKPTTNAKHATSISHLAPSLLASWMYLSNRIWVGGEQRRNQEFRFRFRQCRYRNFWQEKNGKFVNLWIDFREDIFPVYFYSESESYSLKSIQRITNSLAFSCQKFRYRHCRNRNWNSWFLLRSPPSGDWYELWKTPPHSTVGVRWPGFQPIFPDNGLKLPWEWGYACLLKKHVPDS